MTTERGAGGTPTATPNQSVKNFLVLFFQKRTRFLKPLNRKMPSDLIRRHPHQLLVVIE
jgi:hypothetical protein